jgi:hypothetical protein
MSSDTPHGPSTGSGGDPAAPGGSGGFTAELRDALSLRAVLLVVAVLALQLGFVLSYIGAFHAPTPHRIPVAVVAPAAAAGKITAQFNSLPGEPFHARTAPSAAQARSLVLSRDVDAAFVLNPRARTDTLLVASAGGPSVSAAATQVVQKVETARQRVFRVTDLRPPGAKDGRGLSSFYLVLGWMIGGYLAAAILGMAAGARPANVHRTVIRLGSLAVYAIASGLGGAIIADAALGALPGHFAELWGIGTLVVFAAAAATVAFQALLGTAGVGLAILVFVILGNPSAGGAYPASLLPPFWAAIGPWLPPGAGTTTVRNTVYFDAHHTTGPLWVLGCYAAGGIIVALAASLVHRRMRLPGDRR